MLLARADTLGLWVITKDGVIDVINPEEIDTSSATAYGRIWGY